MKKKIYGVTNWIENARVGYVEKLVWAFDNEKDAEEWLRTEQGNFRIRELITKDEAISKFGKRLVESIENF